MTDLGELVGFDAAGFEQRVVVANVIRVAVVGDPGRQDRIESGGEAACESQVEVVEDVEELVGARVNVGDCSRISSMCPAGSLPVSEGMPPVRRIQRSNG